MNSMRAYTLARLGLVLNSAPGLAAAPRTEAGTLPKHYDVREIPMTPARVSSAF